MVILSDLSETFKRLQTDPQGGSHYLLHLLETFLMPFLLQLDQLLEKRLVRTLRACVAAIIRRRANPQVLWLSESGSYRQSAPGVSVSAPAGTKRVGKRLRSVKWTGELIDRSLLSKADEAVKKLKEQKKQVLCIWDGSVVEKAESEKREGWCPVLSSKAKRRSRTKRGLVFNWPSVRPVRVMGMQWTAALIAGMGGLPHLALSRWWTVCHQAARHRRRTVAHHHQEMGAVAPSYL